MKFVPLHNGTITRRAFLSISGGTLLASVSPQATRSGATDPEQRGKVAKTFPNDFLWGASTSAFQIEGATREDGRGPSVWDTFSDQPGAIANSDKPDVACDHYHRYLEDVAVMRRLGLRAYRFSVSWPRILPSGTGPINEKGLSFYSRLVDELLRARITPFLTLFHWDLPLALHERGGWRNRDAADWLAEYASILAQRLSDRVAHWVTVNEPRSLLGGGYLLGVHAPGEKLPLKEVLQAGHHLHVAHGKSVQAIRASARQPVQVSFAPDFSPSLPTTESAADVAAAKMSTFAASREHISPVAWWRHNAWWLDPVFRGAYPQDALTAAGSDAPNILSGDMELIRQPLDFLGVNIYGGYLVRAGADGRAEPVAFPAGWPRTAFNWEVTPDALYWGPKWLHERYGLPVYILENGASFRDWVSLDGQVHDPQRIDFLARYLIALRRALREGTPVKGYFHWSLLDNFEWHAGYRERFGLIYMDFQTQRRILKDSARWYAKLIAANGATLP
jgi:beta-glucosidase